MKAFTGLTVVALFVGGFPHGAAADPVEIKVSLKHENGHCRVSVSTTKGNRLQRSRRDVTVWSFTNTCTTKQNVAVCLLTKGENPLTDCHGGSEDAKINDDFKMGAATSAAATRATATCHVDWEDIEGIDGCKSSKTHTCPKFKFKAFNEPASTDKSLDCPTTTYESQRSPAPSTGKRIGPRSELELEAVP